VYGPQGIYGIRYFNPIVRDGSQSPRRSVLIVHLQLWDQVSGAPQDPPTSGFNQGVRLQYHIDGFRLTMWPSMKSTAVRPSWRGMGPPQFGSSFVTPPVLGASLPGSCTIQQPGFSGVDGVTHLSGSIVLTGLLPASVMYTTVAGLRAPPRTPGHCE